MQWCLQKLESRTELPLCDDTDNQAVWNMAIERAALLQGVDDIQDKLESMEQTHFGDKQAHFESYRDFVRDRLDLSLIHISEPTRPY